MFKTYQKNYQSKNFAKIWKHALHNREIAKNGYHATGDIKKAKAFAKMVSTVVFRTDFESSTEHVIFSNTAWAIPLRAVFVFRIN
ncbi:MAG TPA: hypothetical protein VNW29_00590 [Candidatus Sulfotelmatobacter sp.]|jgi:hypothetical protein|nr:hypothetical protein [Candidatus Sulfotelmatobacter sp.]